MGMGGYVTTERKVIRSRGSLECPICGARYRSTARHRCPPAVLRRIDSRHRQAMRDECPPEKQLTVSQRIELGMGMVHAADGDAEAV